MMDADRLLEQWKNHGFTLVSGVPCSYLTPLINAAQCSPHLRYVNAANEGDAVAIAGGAALAGSRAVVMFQNSGLGNAVNPLTSLTQVFRLPLLLIVTWRGCPTGPADEPQHGLMGAITPGLLDLMGIPWEMFPADHAAVESALERAVERMERDATPVAWIMPKGVIAPRALDRDLVRPHEPLPPPAAFPSTQALEPDAVLRTIQESQQSSDLIVATTGFTGRALYGLADLPNQLYLVGSMGCAASLGLGLALTLPQRRVLVVDGDGAALMRLGCWASLASESPPNLVHILLDNGIHESTGGQATLSAMVDFPRLAAACGYPRVVAVESLDALRGELQSRRAGFRLLHVHTLPRSSRSLPRPRQSAVELARRFSHWIATHDSTFPRPPAAEPGSCHAVNACS